MKSNNGVFDPVLVGCGFLIITLSSALTGAAALKVLLTDFDQPVQLSVNDINLTQNRCWFFCNRGGQP